MRNVQSDDSDSFEGATAVITHRVRNDRHADYEKWHEEMAPLCKAAPGNLDWHIVRPVSGLSETYTIIIRFETDKHLKDWMDSQTRSRMIEKVQPLLVAGDDVQMSSGLDFWFTPPVAKAKVPVRWKQFLVTWSAIFPLVLGLPFLLSPAMRYLGVSNDTWVGTLVLTGVVVCLMVYVIMPRYSRLIGQWLFR